MQRSVRSVSSVMGAAVVVTLLVAASSSGSAARYVDEVFDEVEVTEGVVFADGVEDYRGEEWTLRLDLYEPAGDTVADRPVLVWAHGGSGIGGRRDEGMAVGYANAFARRGWVVASIDYRLYRQELPSQCNFHDFCRAVNPDVDARIKEAAEDFRAAVRFLRANHDEYGVDPDRIVGGGFSYGTVLALLANFQPTPTDVAHPNDANASFPSHISGAVVDSGGMHETTSIDQPAPPVGAGEPPMIGWVYAQDRDGAAALTTTPCQQTQALGNECELHVLESDLEFRHGVGANLAAQDTARFFCEQTIDCTPERPVAETEGLVYGQAIDCQGQPQTLALDLYELADDDRSFRPVYVWAHGGFFKFGNRESGIPQEVVDYVRSGWVVASITYRLCDDIPTGYPGLVESEAPLDDLDALIEATEDAQHDMQAAVRWFRRNAAELRVDASRIAAGGFSAGAITALQTGFDDHDPGNSGNAGYSSVVAAAVSHAGGYLHGVMGSIDPGEPPLAMLHGTHDDVVPMAAAVPACTQTTALLNVCEFTPYPGERHRILGTDVALDFLRRHVLQAGWTDTSLTYEGETDGTDGTLRVRLRLTTAGTEPSCAVVGCGDTPLAEREVHVELADTSVVLVTDENGVADATLRVPRSSSQHELVARYHGEPDHEPSLTTATIQARPGPPGRAAESPPGD